jgi:hypothetical protein
MGGSEMAEVEAAEGVGDEKWTAERRLAFREALAKRREAQLRAGQVVALLLIITAAAGVLLRLPESWWVPAVGAIALGGVGFRLANWKCPGCGERLPSRRRASLCPGCGAPLEEGS